MCGQEACGIYGLISSAVDLSSALFSLHPEVRSIDLRTHLVMVSNAALAGFSYNPLLRLALRIAESRVAPNAPQEGIQDLAMTYIVQSLILSIPPAS